MMNHRSHGAVIPEIESEGYVASNSAKIFDIRRPSTKILAQRKKIK
jgi:hypothetical protein